MEFEHFLELIEKSVEYDAWIKDRGLAGYCEEIVNEAEEALEAVENNDYNHLKEELGDVLSEVIIASKLAEDQELFTFSQVVKSAIEKIKRRRPYVLENKKVTKEEAVKLWYEAKKKEKKS